MSSENVLKLEVDRKMAHNTDTNFDTTLGQDFGRIAFSPLRTVGHFLQSIVASNRLAKEVEVLTHASDRKLADLGLKRDEIVQYVARSSENFRAI